MLENSAILVKQLRATLGKMEVAFGAIVEAIVWTNEFGKVHWSNATFDRLVERQRFQVLTASLFDLLPLKQQGREISQELHPLSMTLNGQSNVTGVYQFPQADKTLVLEISCTRIQFQGEQPSAIVVIRDITKAQQARERQAMQFALTRILAESTTLSEAIPLLLQAICYGTGYLLGTMWQVDAKSNSLRCSATWHSPHLEATDFEHISKDFSLTPGEGLPGRVWASGQPAWITDVVKDSNFPRAEVAAKTRLHGAFAFPILNGTQVTGVMEFFSRHPSQPDEKLIRLMVDMGSQINQFASRRRAEDALRANEEFLRLVLDNIPQFIFWKDRNSVYLGCNRNFALAAGLNNPDEIVGKTDYDLAWKKEESDFFRECDARVMETNTPEYHIIETQLQADGKQAWLDTNKIPLHDSVQNVVGILGTYEDITSRVLAEEALLKANSELEIRVDERTAQLMNANALLQSEIACRVQVEENLRKSQEMLQLVMDNIPQSISWKDKNSVYLGCNRNFARLAGVGNPENIVGKTDYDLPWQQEQADFFRECDARVRETDMPEYHIITQIPSADGAPAWLDNNKIPFHDAEGNVVGILVTIEDISDRQRAEEEIRNALEKEKQLSELKSRFITMASHEFRTPLATIFSSSELIQHYGYKFSEEKKLKHLNQIQTQVKRMTRLLEDVLFVGKASAGRMQFNPVMLNLKEFCREVIDEIELTDGKRHAFNFDCRIDGSMVEMDDKLLRQLLANLLGNAVKYSPQGSAVDFKVILDNSQAIFEIKDSGIGIPPEDRERLFEVFHRGSNVGNISGTGVGMAIVKQAVELHGGAIAFESQVGAGTTFTVSLPTRQPQHEPRARLQPAGSPETNLYSV